MIGATRFGLALAVTAGLIASASANVPGTVGFSARLVDEASGDAVTGAHRISFELFDAETGGTAVWQEGREIDVDDGLLFTELGANKPLDPTILDGRALWLEVKLDDIKMEPRLALDSVPYAIRAAEADAVGGVSEPQQRITGACGTGNFVISINADGTVVCAPDLSGSGDVTAVFAGNGLQGGGSSGDLTLSLIQTCLTNQILKWNGVAWACAAESAGGGGDVTAVVVGPAGGLQGGGTSGDLVLSLLGTCAVNQVLKWNGATWSCGNDVDTDTNSGGDITSVTTAVGTGLQGGAAAGDAALSLLTTCATGQLLKWTGSSWGCANDTDTDTNSGGDITGVTAGNGLTGGGTVGAVSLAVGGGTGITVGASTVSLDTAYADGRYVNQAGDTMTGTLAMGGFRVTNRGCPAGYVAVGPTLCTEDVDASPFTFSGCANRCRAAGAHMCSSAEMRAVMSSGVTLTSITLLDWVDDQDAEDSALYVNSSDSANPDGARATTTASYCRCCTDVE